MDKDIIQLLIKKYGEGLTSEEETLLQQWCETSGKNQEFYQWTNEIFNPKATAGEKTERAWNILQQNIKANDKRKKQKTGKVLFLWGGVAASLLILFGLTLSLLYSRPASSEEFGEIRTTFGQTSSFILPDSSTIWLAGGSYVKFPVRFTGQNRRIQLQGEAFFDVRKGKGEFVVITGNTRTIVKGTRFNVKAYPEDDAIETTLIEGKVDFLFSEQEISLQPEERIVYNKPTGTIEKQSVTYFNCCIDDEYRFENQSLGEVMLYLKRLYNVNTKFENEDLQELHYSGVIRKNNTLEHTLQVITTTLNIDGELSDQTIVLKSRK